jgi:hypothetical protein
VETLKANTEESKNPEAFNEGPQPIVRDFYPKGN